ncbi:MAG: DUF928 domain-containing protein [Thainema sp.]
MVNISFKKGVCWVKVGLIVASLLLSSPSAMAQIIEFPPTGDRRGPIRTAGGGTRSGPNCIARVPEPLTAIAPTNNWIKTVGEESNLFWYVPPTVAAEALFELRESAGELIYSTTIELSGEASIVSLQLPSDLELQSDQVYSWKLSPICDRERLNLNPFVEGWISRVEADAELAVALAEADDPIAQAQLYANAELWPETVAIAAALRETQPEIWQQLLTSVGLESIAGVPFAVVPPEL